MFIYQNKKFETIEIKKQNTKTNILFIHGFTSNFQKHLFLKDYLPQDVSFYALNLPGCGKTPPYISMWNSRENYAKIIAAYVVSLNLKNVLVIAHSMGASITAFLTKYISNRIVGYILESPENVAILQNRSIIINVKDDDTKTIRAKIANFLYDPKNPNKNWLRKMKLINRILAHPKVIKVFYDLAIEKYMIRSLSKTNELFKKIDKPTLVMFGTQDNIILYQNSLKNFQQNINNKNFELISIQNSGHSIYRDQKEIYLTLVLKFIKENDLTNCKIALNNKEI